MEGNSILEIVRALRCISTAQDRARDCAACRYWRKETLTPEYKEKLGVDEWGGCDIERIGLDAAEKLETLEALEAERRAANEA